MEKLDSTICKPKCASARPHPARAKEQSASLQGTEETFNGGKTMCRVGSSRQYNSQRQESHEHCLQDFDLDPGKTRWSTMGI